MRIVTWDNGVRVVRDMTPEEIAERYGPTVSRLQGRVALLNAGLLDDVEAAIAASSDAVLKMAWEDAAEWRRNSDMIKGMADVLGLSDAQVDELFAAASAVAL